MYTHLFGMNPLLKSPSCFCFPVFPSCSNLSSVQNLSVIPFLAGSERDSPFLEYEITPSIKRVVESPNHQPTIIHQVYSNYTAISLWLNHVKPPMNDG